MAGAIESAGKEEMKELTEHLSALRRAGAIEEWHDREIVPGVEWGGEIDQNLERADVILLLVSGDFQPQPLARAAAVGLARHSTERNSEGWQLDHSGSVSASDEHDPVGAPSAMRSWSAVVSSVGVLAYVVSLPSPQSPPACRA